MAHHISDKAESQCVLSKCVRNRGNAETEVAVHNGCTWHNRQLSDPRLQVWRTTANVREMPGELWRWENLEGVVHCCAWFLRSWTVLQLIVSPTERCISIPTSDKKNGKQSKTKGKHNRTNKYITFKFKRVCV